MKKLIVLLAVLFASTAFAAETDKEPRYQVDISITYNAETAEDAARIAADVLQAHKKACTGKVVIKKVDTINFVSGTTGYSIGIVPWNGIRTIN